MDNKKWADALNEISDEYIQEAADPPKRKKFPWADAIAGTLAAAMLTILLSPLAGLVLLFQGAGSAAPTTAFPTEPSDTHDSLPLTEVILLAATPRNQERFNKSSVFKQTEVSASARYDFFRESSRLLLSGTDGNALWSPVNAWLNLVMTTRLTNGETHQEFLDALGASDMETLTTQASSLWEAIYVDEAAGKCKLANSVWLDLQSSYNPDTMEALAYDYYASIYHTDLGTPESNESIGNWLNQQTEGFLEKYTQAIDIPEDTLLALYSTIYFQGRWNEEFNADASTTEIFHTPDGEVSCSYMNKTGYPSTYYWSDHFGAVCLGMRNGAGMWFILPDEGVSVDQILADDDYLMLVANRYDSVIAEYTWRDRVSTKINLSIPKFDIDSQIELSNALLALGIERAFDPETADFSQAFPDGDIYLQSITQSVRVAIDEEGVTAAAFTEMLPGAAPPPEEIIDFILDRPFLFVIERAGVPLFVGVVNDPTA